MGGLLKHIHFSAPKIKTSCELQLFFQNLENGRPASASLPRREQRQSSLSVSDKGLRAPGLTGTGLLLCVAKTSSFCQSDKGSVKENHSSDSFGEHSMLRGAARLYTGSMSLLERQTCTEV